MFRNFLLVSLRFLLKQKLYSLINCAGIAIAITTCLFIYAWVDFQTSFDDHVHDAHRVYRVTTGSDGSDQRIASTYPMVQTRVLPQFSEIESSGRVYSAGLLGSKTLVKHDQVVISTKEFYYADASILDILSFKFVQGAEKQFEGPEAIIVSSSTAKRLFSFGSETIGQILDINDRKYHVVGVFEDFPKNAHFHPQLVATMDSHPFVKNAEQRVWSGVVFHTYAKIRADATARELEQKISDFMDRFPNDPGGIGKTIDLRLQPIRDIHLKSAFKFELEPNGDYQYVVLFTTIGILILIVAVINYTNLSTARQLLRMKEVGVRKVLGARSIHALYQISTEALLVITASFVLSLIAVTALMPLYELYTGHDLEISLIDLRLVGGVVVGLFAALIVANAVFPAFRFGAIKTVSLFKPQNSTSGKMPLRKMLITFQFIVSIVLTLATVVWYQQLNFLKQTDLGYRPDQTLVLDIDSHEILQKYQLLKAKITSSDAVVGCTASSQLPSDIQTGENIDLPGSRTTGVYCASVDEDFFKVMGVEIVEGSVSGIQLNDTLNHFALNQRALQEIGWSSAEALQNSISIRHGNQKPGSVVAVYKNFNFQSLHNSIEPLVLEFNPSTFRHLLVKTRSGRESEAIAHVTRCWAEVTGGLPFDYMFLDQEYEKLYRKEALSSQLFAVFTFIALAISLLGLFGLASFSMQRRVKEIGVRKVLGATTANILAVLVGDFLILFVVAVLIAVPVGYYGSTEWLSSFAYRIKLSPWVFLLSGLANIGIGLLIIVYHSVVASNADPVKTLRYE